MCVVVRHAAVVWAVAWLMIASASSHVFIFQLPEVIVKMNTTYLSKNEATRLRCEIFDNIANLSIGEVTWIKDSLPVAELPPKKGGADISLDDKELIILKGTHHTEGEYQCSTIIQDIPLTENVTINTKLISAPVGLRKARITRFETFHTPTIKVRQGQVARLPCLGMPDVIPGPPDVWFEREGFEGVPLGITSNLRFVSTQNGLQIAIAQPNDAGKYYCVVRNTHTNQTRRSSLPVILSVDKKDNVTRDVNKRPSVVYPMLTNYSKTIEVHAVVGSKVILECVIWHSRVVWSNENYTMAPVTLTDETARVRQIWGNLRFKRVELQDSGIYECHGLDRWNESMPLNETHHPRVRFQLKVHAPTDVNLVVNQALSSKYLQINCFVSHSNYEIPMVYINGDPLIDATEKLGISAQPNFFANPMNVTLSTSQPVVGSIQCISKPAMNEAEVYGDGLERGRSMNLYVADKRIGNAKIIEQGPTNLTKTVGTNAQLTCVPGSSKVNFWWLKDNTLINVTNNARYSLVGSATLMINNLEFVDQGWYTCVGRDSRRTNMERAFLHILTAPPTTQATETFAKEVIKDLRPPETYDPLVIYKPKGFVGSGQNVRLQWNLPVNHPQLISLTGFQIEKQASDSTLWLLANSNVPPHVRALTVTNLPSNKRFSFRVIGLLENGSRIHSAPTDLMGIGAVPQPLPKPKITNLEAMSHTMLRLKWEYLTGMPITKDDKFHVTYKSVNNSVEDLDSFNVTGLSQAIIQDLEPNTQYAVSIYAINNETRSALSRVHFATTFDEAWAAAHIESSGNQGNSWQTIWSTLQALTSQNTFRWLVISALCVVALLCVGVFTCVCLWWLCSKDNNELSLENKVEGQRSNNLRLCFAKRSGSSSVNSEKPIDLSPLDFSGNDRETEEFHYYVNRNPNHEPFDLNPARSFVDMPHPQPPTAIETTSRHSSKSHNSADKVRTKGVHTSIISLDTVVGVRMENAPYAFNTLKENPKRNYVNVRSSDANLYSTYRQNSRYSGASAFSPLLGRKRDAESAALLHSTNHAFSSPESSTVSPMSQTSLNTGSEIGREVRPPPLPPPMSTFRPHTNSLSAKDSFNNKHKIHHSVIEGAIDLEGPEPEAV